MPLKKVSNESVSEEYKREEILPVKAAQQPMIQWVISEPKYTLDDLILDAETTAQLLDVISYFKNRELLFQCWGLSEKFFSQSSMAVNLYGPPGTGKTVAAHAIVHELQSKMICVDYAEIESKYVGETSKNLTRLFQLAEKEGAIIFFDEADALLSKRVTNMTSATDVSVNQTRSVLLNLPINTKVLLYLQQILSKILIRRFCAGSNIMFSFIYLTRRCGNSFGRCIFRKKCHVRWTVTL